jgi:hypothetical protein
MATPAMAILTTCTLSVNLFSGARTPLPPQSKPLLTVRNGNQDTVKLPNNGFLKASSITITKLPFFNNFGDSYAVIASASGYRQSGFHPVKLNPLAPAIVDLMLIGNDATFNFRDAQWTALDEHHPEFTKLLRAGTGDEEIAADRYSQLMETRPEALACFFNLATAMSQIHLPLKTPLDYIEELIWDQTMAGDRFFAWADPDLVDQVAQAASQGEFSPEPGTAAFHKGATRSWKQIRFGEANVQLTFHENNKKRVGGKQCILVEPDIDYFKDALAHAILEVAVNTLTHSLTDPRQVYALRWMAGRHAGVPNFEPPYTLE